MTQIFSENPVKVSAKRIVYASLCPLYEPHANRSTLGKHAEILKDLYSTLASRGYICVYEANIRGAIGDFVVNGRADIVCVDFRRDELQIYEVKSVDICHDSYVLQATLYAILLAKDRLISTDQLCRVVINVVCGESRISYRLCELPEQYIAMLLEALVSLRNGNRRRGPWCKYCRFFDQCSMRHD